MSATTSIADRIDGWIASPDVRTHHRGRSDADPDAVWAAAGDLRLSDTRTLGRLVRWRIPGTPADQTFRGLLAAYPFVVLEEGERYSISGLCGRIWTLSRDYPRLDGAADFDAWETAGTVRIVFATWAEAGDDGATVLVNEARIEALGRSAGLRLRALWATIGRFEPLIGREAIGAALRRVDSQDRAAS